MGLDLDPSLPLIKRVVEDALWVSDFLIVDLSILPLPDLVHAPTCRALNEHAHGEAVQYHQNRRLVANEGRQGNANHVVMDPQFLVRLAARVPPKEAN